MQPVNERGPAPTGQPSTIFTPTKALRSPVIVQRERDRCVAACGELCPWMTCPVPLDDAIAAVVVALPVPFLRLVRS